MGISLEKIAAVILKGKEDVLTKNGVVNSDYNGIYYQVRLQEGRKRNYLSIYQVMPNGLLGIGLVPICK